MQASNQDASGANKSNESANSNTNAPMQQKKETNVLAGTRKTADIQTREIANQINAYFPHPAISALSAILLFFLLGKIVDWLVTKVLARIVRRTRSNLDDKILNLLHRPIFLSVVLVGLGFAMYLLQQSEAITYTTIHILQSIAVFVWFRFALRLINTVLEELESIGSGSQFVTPATKPLLLNTFAIIAVAVAVYIVFLIWGINITAWIASAGIIGLAVSFAAKDTLANIFGGVAIFADKPFKVGDYVVLDGGDRGVITKIGVRSTRILTRDDIEITVPNGILATTTIINESGGPHEKFRIRVKIGVAYGSDLDLVEETLMEIAKTHEEVCDSPEPRVRLRNFGDWSLDHELLCWVERPVLRGRILHELNREIYAKFEENGIQIPFPRQEVYLGRV
ncbi:MAG: mechanosensitive ion channel family protein [Acidobacteriota bacterium]|nr:mechanosensitive ion channel family protein [Acidobacteriota bacterium]MDH3529197.1 mechanosensitive ion channel family protein [Acidobacteriota bacterium]